MSNLMSLQLFILCVLLILKIDGYVKLQVIQIIGIILLPEILQLIWYVLKLTLSGMRDILSGKIRINR